MILMTVPFMQNKESCQTACSNKTDIITILLRFYPLYENSGTILEHIYLYIYLISGQIWIKIRNLFGFRFSAKMSILKAIYNSLRL